MKTDNTLPIALRKDLGTFDAAHQLPHHHGKCSNLHGHTYRVVIEVHGYRRSADGTSSEGMVIDFSILKELYKARIDQRLDHSLMLGTTPLGWVTAMEDRVGDLEDVGIGKIARLSIPVTTAEYLAEWMANEMWSGLRDQGLLENITSLSIEVFETVGSSASFVIDHIWLEGNDDTEDQS